MITMFSMWRYGVVAEAAQELTPDVATEFIEWFFKR
jgi:hypothetical protein